LKGCQVKETLPLKPTSEGMALGRIKLPSLMTVVGASTSVWSMLAALLVAAGFILIARVNPIDAYGAMWTGAFGSPFAIGQTVAKTAPLLLAALGVAFAFRCGVFNIGAEGQMFVGGGMAAIVALAFKDLSPFIHLPLVLISAFIAGAVWAAIPGALKAYRGMNEIITTIMMNYIAQWLVSFLVADLLLKPAAEFPKTSPFPASATLPVLWPGTYLHAGILLGLVGAVAIYLILWKTRLGFQVRAVGAGQIAAMQSGMNVGKNMVIAMAISGGLCALAGTMGPLGVTHELVESFTQGYGYESIAVALMGGLHPAGIVPVSLFFGALHAGANQMQQSVGLPTMLVSVVQGLAIIFVLCGLALRVRMAKRAARRVAHVGIDS
jgi:general nucleoside transport system permease protein